MIKILDPVAKPREEKVVSPVSIESLSGKAVGFLSNEWVCLKIILERLSELLHERGKVAKTFKVPIPLVAPASREVLDEAATRSNAVIVGIAN